MLYSFQTSITTSFTCSPQLTMQMSCAIIAIVIGALVGPLVLRTRSNQQALTLDQKPKNRKTTPSKVCKRIKLSTAFSALPSQCVRITAEKMNRKCGIGNTHRTFLFRNSATARRYCTSIRRDMNHRHTSNGCLRTPTIRHTVAQMGNRKIVFVIHLWRRWASEQRERANQRDRERELEIEIEREGLRTCSSQNFRPLPTKTRM